MKHFTSQRSQITVPVLPYLIASLGSTSSSRFASYDDIVESKEINIIKGQSLLLSPSSKLSLLLFFFDDLTFLQQAVYLAFESALTSFLCYHIEAEDADQTCYFPQVTVN